MNPPLSIRYTRYRLDENDMRDATEKHRPKLETEYCDLQLLHKVQVFEARHAAGSEMQRGIVW